MATIQDILLKTLSVMTLADTNVHQCEVKMVQQIMKDELGVEVDSAAVHVASKDEFLEDRSIPKYLKKVGGDLSYSDKRMIMRSLVKIVSVDDRTSEGEAEMFNGVAAALKLTPADMIGL